MVTESNRKDVIDPTKLKEDEITDCIIRNSRNDVLMITPRLWIVWAREMITPCRMFFNLTLFNRYFLYSYSNSFLDANKLNQLVHSMLADKLHNHQAIFVQHCEKERALDLGAGNGYDLTNGFHAL